MPRISSAAVALGSLRAASGTFEDQDATIAGRDFFGLPGRAYSFAKAGKGNPEQSTRSYPIANLAPESQEKVTAFAKAMKAAKE